MQGYNFTERVRKVLAMAREEAARLHHEYVGTEHLLLGILREGEGVASTVLLNLKVDADTLRRAVEVEAKQGNADKAAGPDLPYTSRAKKVLDFAMHEARQLVHSYVGTEHVLLGLIAEAQGIGGHVLIQHGVTLEIARAETIRILGADPAMLREQSVLTVRNRVRLRPWFRNVGWFYVPVAPAGVVVTLAAMAFCVQVFVAVDRNSHSVSDTLYGIFPFFGVTFLLWNWIASKASR